MGKEKSPAFQWYPKDILGSARVAEMTLEEEGAYRRALDFCWLNGTLPADIERLALVIGKGCSIATAEVVSKMFEVDKKHPDRIFHKRLKIEKQKQEAHSQKRSRAGVASGISRRKKNKLASEQVFTECLNKARTKTNSPSSSSTAIINTHPKPSLSEAKNGACVSVFPLAICEEYAIALARNGYGINTPEAFARAIQKNGSEDARIQAWLDMGKVMPPKVVQIAEKKQAKFVPAG